jgi:hypothetical protein
MANSRGSGKRTSVESRSFLNYSKLTLPRGEHKVTASISLFSVHQTMNASLREFVEQR